MVIGLFLILGAVTVFSQSRSTYRTAESVARLQELAGRYGARFTPDAGWDLLR